MKIFYLQNCWGHRRGRWGHQMFKFVKNCQNLGQVIFPHHSDQMSQRSQVSWVALWMSISKVLWVSQSVSELVTRSPFELFWTAKKIDNKLSTTNALQCVNGVSWDISRYNFLLSNFKTWQQTGIVKYGEGWTWFLNRSATEYARHKTWHIKEKELGTGVLVAK